MYFFNGFNCLIWRQRKYLLPLFLILIGPFISFLNLRRNSMYLLPDNRLKLKILTYSWCTDWITQSDSLLIQLSILHNIYGKTLSTIYLELVIVLIVELKEIGINSASPFSLYLLNKSFTVIWHLKTLIATNKSLNNAWFTSF